ncbi:histidine--tRNA ligase [Facilibium subflavum]|uniref:histidine--tRNA ligase n=1 Tax=Facilibium subflavum TaxID=2219058 RepID=UPI000E65880F|nr:histidine--tRNA ligase [Facilibium subflavum]
MSKIQAVRGMNDILPEEIGYWHYFEDIVKQLLASYGYSEIRLPIIEKSQLFHRGVGSGTDIVEKETYDFTDRSDEALTLRPEGTAGCVRAMIEHGLLRNQLQKLWYLGPMFRYERPQKGRYRQFYQFGVEVYGSDHISQDAELLSLTWRLWQKLKLNEYVTLQINNLGSNEDRQAYIDALVEYLTPLKDQLDADSQRRLTKNPLRILDTKDENTKTLLINAPKMEDFINTSSQSQFLALYHYLTSIGIPVEVNPYLVRGLDYYSDTVFEWVTDKLGAQGTICAGGRYDKLVEGLNGPPTPAVGFAMGIERIILLLKTLDQAPIKSNRPDIYIISDTYSVFESMQYIEGIRQRFPQLVIEQNTTLGSFKSQFKKADKSGADLAIVIAENELSTQSCIVKFLRKEKEQICLTQDKLYGFLRDYFSTKNKNAELSIL